MKTIEERAKEWAESNYFPDGQTERQQKSIIKAYTKIYSKIATVQRKIDIDMACKWFGEYLMDIGYPDNWCRDSEAQESGEKRFRKAMEE